MMLIIYLSLDEEYPDSFIPTKQKEAYEVHKL